MTNSASVTVRVEKYVAVVSLSRPHARNALDLPMCLELTDIFRTLSGDPGVRAVLLRGEGAAFCAGADLKERANKDATWVRERRLASFAAYRAIERCARPVIALVHGTVVGSGGEMAMASDFVYAAEGTTFRFPEVHWGTIGATQRLQRVVGKRKAKELLFTNGVLEVEEALARGLVARVVAGPELLETGLRIAERMARAPDLSLRLTKQAIDRGHEVTLEQGIAIEMAAIEHNLAEGPWLDGIARFGRDHRFDSSSGDASRSGTDHA